jgi:hypothetical protein
MIIRLPDDKPRYFTGEPIEIVEKLAAQPQNTFDHRSAAEYMEIISRHLRNCGATKLIRYDTPDHFLLDLAAIGWLVIVPEGEPLEPGVVI